MPQFGRQKKLTDYLYTKPVIATLVIVAGFLAVSVFERYQIEQEMTARREAAEADYQAAVARKDELQAKVDYFQGERGIEEEIRKHFDVAKAGEQVVILLGEDQSTSTLSTVAEDVPEKRWYQFWR